MDKWIYKKTENRGVIIEKCLSEDFTLFIPETIEGLPVIEIDSYAFENHRNLQCLELPNTIHSIGSHAFYNCRNLKKLILWDNLSSIADGAFKNCGALNEIVLQKNEGSFTCLKSILAELNQSINCRIINRQEIAQLVFPRYLHDYVENTMARIINQETHGSGVHYRETVMKEGILYAEYDRLFSVAEAVDMAETLYQIVLGRLFYPVQLLDNAKEQYVSYFHKHFADIVTWLLKEKQKEGLYHIGKYEETKEEESNLLLELLRKQNELELVTELLQMKLERFGQAKEKKFEL